MDANGVYYRSGTTIHHRGGDFIRQTLYFLRKDRGDNRDEGLRHARLPENFTTSRSGNGPAQVTRPTVPMPRSSKRATSVVT